MFLFILNETEGKNEDLGRKRIHSICHVFTESDLEDEKTLSSVFRVIHNAAATDTKRAFVYIISIGSIIFLSLDGQQKE